MKTNISKWVLATTVVAVAGLPALAQADYFSRDKYESVTQRSQPQFDPQPLRVGAFNVRPSLEAGAYYISNVFAAENDEESDTVALIAANIVADSNWSRHGLGAFASVETNEYLDFSRASYDSQTVGLRGRFDVNREIWVTPRLTYQQAAEQRFDFVQSTATEAPVEFERLVAGLDANYQTGRLRLLASGTVVENDFDDAELLNSPGVLDQDFRDSTEQQLRVRGTYAVNPNIAVFGQAEAYERDYDEEVVIDNILRSRDQDGTIVSAGLDFETTTLLRGDFAVGYFDNNSVDSFFEDTDGLFVDGRLTWFMTRLTNLTFTGSRRAVDLGLRESSSATQTRYGVRVDHELRRNVLLYGETEFFDAEYDSIDRTDDRFDVGAGAIYKLNPNAHLRAFARHISRDTSGVDAATGETFDNQIVGLSITLYP